MPPKKRKAPKNKNNSSSSSSAPPAVRVKVEHVGETNDAPIDLVDDIAPTSDQLAASRVEGEKRGEKKARAEIAINNANDHMMCPIGLTLMFRPVIAADGNNYEEKTLMTWLKDSDLSPLDNSKISAKGLI